MAIAAEHTHGAMHDDLAPRVRLQTNRFGLWLFIASESFLFSAVIAVPLSYAGRTLTWVTRGLQALAGVIAIGIGLHVMVETGTVLFG